MFLFKIKNISKNKFYIYLIYQILMNKHFEIIQLKMYHYIQMNKQIVVKAKKY
jgi:hypothetical protein